MIDDPTLSQLERKYALGLTSVEILDVCASHDVSLSEATLRKYVQLGLLPRSVRVGRKGKHQGSQGVYPVSVIRQNLRIKQMMSESYTIEQIPTRIFVHQERRRAAGADAEPHLQEAGGRPERAQARALRAGRAPRRAGRAWYQ